MSKDVHTFQISFFAFRSLSISREQLDKILNFCLNRNVAKEGESWEASRDIFLNILQLFLKVNYFIFL